MGNVFGIAALAAPFALAALVAQGDAAVAPAGWVGAGLLGSVLAWLLFVHLPAKDKQLQIMIDGKDAQARDMAASYSASLAAIMAHAREESTRHEDALTRHHSEMIDWLRRLHESTREAVHATRNLHTALNTRTQLADAFQSAEVPAWTKRLDGMITAWNGAAERLLGWGQGEIVGKSVFDGIIPPDRHAEERELMRRISQGESVREVDTVRMHKDGRRMMLTIMVSPVRDVSGRVIGASSIAREILT